MGNFCFLFFESWVHIPSTIKFQNFKPLTILFDCTVRFVSDLVGNSEDRFSQDVVHIISCRNNLFFGHYSRATHVDIRCFSIILPIQRMKTRGSTGRVKEIEQYYDESKTRTRDYHEFCGKENYLKEEDVNQKGASGSESDIV